MWRSLLHFLLVFPLQTMQMFRPLIPIPGSVRTVKLPPLESVNSFYFLHVSGPVSVQPHWHTFSFNYENMQTLLTTLLNLSVIKVQVIRDERFPAVRRDYLPIQSTPDRLWFSSTMTSCECAGLVAVCGCVGVCIYLLVCQRLMDACMGMAADPGNNLLMYKDLWLQLYNYCYSLSHTFLTSFG